MSKISFAAAFGKNFGSVAKKQFYALFPVGAAFVLDRELRSEFSIEHIDLFSKKIGKYFIKYYRCDVDSAAAK